MTDDTAQVARIIRAGLDKDAFAYADMSDGEVLHHLPNFTRTVRLALAEGRREGARDIERERNAHADERLLRLRLEGLLVQMTDASAEWRKRYEDAVRPPDPAPTRSLADVVAEYEWHDDGFRKQVYADKATGRIVGSVDNECAYTVHSGSLGRYVTSSKARAAVEHAIEAERIGEAK